MHIFIHIDGVQAPAYVCKSCGEVLPTDDSLKEHLRMSEGDQALLAANNEKLECGDDHENNISLESVKEEIVEQTEKQSSSKETRKTLRKSFSDICNTHTVTQVAEKLRCDDSGILCTSDHVNVHTVPSAKRHHKCDVCELRPHLIMGYTKGAFLNMAIFDEKYRDMNCNQVYPRKCQNNLAADPFTPEVLETSNQQSFLGQC
ncbi:zinc finger and SCAN domain-containing protein 26-like [Schistocerca serialis cubense]|uniref:zinc finger and SCAN domain-containing protein 26-like n=1 Tax=Schistocerca serialis cubense TaxID=2023355 RepID=UPI00214EF17D|nr:zinc finger and SCAN domain-containing protein 26-like [Schistocerca serialis cubense]